MKRPILLVLVGLILSGCVGARTSMLDERTAIISGRGDAFVSLAQVEQRILLQAAQTAQAHGYEYFAILNGRDQSTAGIAYFPGQTHTSAAATTTGTFTGPYYNANTTYSGSTYTTPGTAVGFVKPGEDVTVRFFHANEIDPSKPGVWSVASILAAQAPAK